MDAETEFTNRRATGRSAASALDTELFGARKVTDSNSPPFQTALEP
jgi:hypothetical protein